MTTYPDSSARSTFPGKPTAIVAPHGAEIFQISWPAEVTHRIPNHVLRGFCPCAGCQGHGGEMRYQGGKNSELRDIRPVGNYALSLVWGDAHESGIYTFEYLYQLGSLHAEWGTDALIAVEALARGRIVAAGSPAEDG